MKKFLLASACLIVAPLAAQAGALEKSGQPVTLLFEKGDVVQLDLAYVVPTVTGVDANGIESNDAADDFTRYGGGIKKDFTDQWSGALIIDEPYGAELFYEPDDFALGGTSADFHSVELTGLARYKVNPNFSVHGGLRVARFGGEVGSGGAAYGPLDGYSFEGDDDYGIGYVVGAAYEIPEKALRVALTYGSAIDFELDSTEQFPAAVGGFTFEGKTDITMPSSVNLDFQSGIAPKTLLFGSVRWTNYDGWDVVAPGLFENFDAKLSEKDYDIWNYKLGLGRQINAQWAAVVQATYENSVDKPLGALSPTDGSFGLGAGASYTMASGTRITGGADYRWLGDSDVEGPFAGAEFTDNDAVGLGLVVTVPF